MPHRAGPKRINAVWPHSDSPKSRRHKTEWRSAAPGTSSGRRRLCKTESPQDRRVTAAQGRECAQGRGSVSHGTVPLLNFTAGVFYQNTRTVAPLTDPSETLGQSVVSATVLPHERLTAVVRVGQVAFHRHAASHRGPRERHRTRPKSGQAGPPPLLPVPASPAPRGSLQLRSGGGAGGPPRGHHVNRHRMLVLWSRREQSPSGVGAPVGHGRPQGGRGGREPGGQGCRGGATPQGCLLPPSASAQAETFHPHSWLLGWGDSQTGVWFRSILINS